MRKKQKLAVPELVLGLPWTITEGPGKTSPKEKVLSVPLGTDQRSQAVRAHELAHIRWSPKDPAKAMRDYTKDGGEPDTLNAVEDARVNILAFSRGVNLSELYPIEDLEKFREQFLSDPKKPLDRETGLHLARAYIALRAYYHSGQGPSDALLGILESIEKRMGPLSHNLAHIYSALVRRPERFATAKRCAKALDMLFPREENVRPLSSQLSELELDRSDRPGSYRKDARWLPMRIVRLPMPRVSRGALKARSVRPADMGAFRYAHRIPPAGDGSVFGTRKKVLSGGGILIDDSGSMSIPPEDVVRLVEAAPFGKVAKYSADYFQGTLAILADRGRLAIPADIQRDFGKGNGVDGPALRWLVANSRPPYIWVSDTYVTGEGDHYSEKLLQECMDVVRKHNVKICENVEEALEYLKTIKK